MKILLASESYWPNLDGGAQFQHQLVHGMMARGNQVVVWAPGTSLRSSIEHDGASTIYRERAIRSVVNKRYYFSLWPFMNAFRIIGREKPDIVHIQTPLQIGLAALIAARWYHIPVVATNHIMPENILSFALPKPLFKMLSKLIWYYIIVFHNHVDYVTTPSKIALSYLQQYKLKTPAQTITNGVDLSIFNPTSRSANDPPKLLYLGRIDSEKNILPIIDAAVLLKDRVDFRLELAGAGDQIEKLKKYAETKGVSSLLHFWGRVSEMEKIKIYQSADIFVIMSPAELQSIVTMEAMACALPVIAANAGALPNLVDNGVNGYLVDYDDATALAEKCQKLLLSAEMRHKFGQASLKIIKQSHSNIITYDAYEKVYQKLIKKSVG